MIFHNLMINRGSYDWATPQIIHQLLYENHVECPLDRDGMTNMCHVLQEGEKCWNSFPEEVSLEAEDKFHDDCLYFWVFRQLKRRGLKGLYRLSSP